MFRTALLAALVALPTEACAAVSVDMGAAPADWPELVVEIRVVSADEAKAACRKYSLFSSACAEIFFVDSRCVVWIRPDASYAVLQHEISHCHGSDHEGQSTLRDAWAAWKASK